MKFGFLFYFVTLIYLVKEASSKDGVQMRMVEEPVNMGQWNNEPATDVLTPKVKPANFSGPPHLKQLMGKCFEVVENSYKYSLCPFQNITQHEQSHRWNPYSGILGVLDLFIPEHNIARAEPLVESYSGNLGNWYEWSIENNTFLAMIYKNGDDCGAKSRQVSVTLQCGKRTAIVAVSEPTTCCYAMNLSTPLVCHPHSLLVYPTLTKPLQRKWDALEGRLYREEITKQGYNKMLHKVFEEAGLVMDPSIAPKKVYALTEEEKTFETLETCQQDYNSLLEEVKRLRAQEQPVENELEELHDDHHDEYEPSVNFDNYRDDYGRGKPLIDDPFMDAF